MIRSAYRVGLLLPSTNLVVENEMNKSVSDDINFYTARLYSNKQYSLNKNDFLTDLNQQLSSTAKQLEKLQLGCIAYFCTSASIQLSHNELSEELLAYPVHRIDALASILTAARHLGFKRALLITPYDDSIGSALRVYLEKRDVGISKVYNRNIIHTNDYYEFGFEGLYEYVIQRARKADYDGVIISCTNLPTFHLLKKLENELRIPVISSNSAALWKITNGCGSQPIIDLGKLFERKCT